MYFDFRTKIELRLAEPISEEVIRELVEEFDSCRIWLDARGKSGWWGTRTKYGLPSSHMTRDEIGLHISGNDMNDGRAYFSVRIDRDGRLIEVDAETAPDVAKVLRRHNLEYEIDMGIEEILHRDESASFKERLKGAPA